MPKPDYGYSKWNIHQGKVKYFKVFMVYSHFLAHVNISKTNKCHVTDQLLLEDEKSKLLSTRIITNEYLFSALWIIMKTM